MACEESSVTKVENAEKKPENTISMFALIFADKDKEMFALILAERLKMLQVTCLSVASIQEKRFLKQEKVGFFPIFTGI